MGPSGSPDLDSLLQDLKHSGKVDSSGRFTLDLGRALEKLARFRLPQPGDYVLSLVAAASLSGASCVSVRWEGHCFELAFDGRPFQAGELEALFSSLLDEAASPRLRELAVGLHAARAHTPRSVQLECWEGTRGTRLELKPSAVVLEPLRERPWKDPAVCTRVQVRQRLGQSVARWWKGEGPEGPLLRRRCCFGPFRLEVSGQSVSMPLRSLVRSYRFPGELSLGVVSEHETTSDAPFSGVCGLAAAGGPAELYFILNGVAFLQPDLGFPPGFCAWITWSQWSRDLSLASLVRDSAWDRAKNVLHNKAKELLMHFAEDSQSHLDRLAPALTWLLQDHLKLAEALPLFTLGKGERGTLNELKLSYKKWGCLWLRMRGEGPPRFPDGTPLLESLDDWAGRFLRERFPNFQLVLAGPNPVPVRLPVRQRLVGEHYLATVHTKLLELGLPDREPEQSCRITVYRGHGLAVHDERNSDLSDTLLPNGLHVCVILPTEGPEPDFESVTEMVLPQVANLFHQLWMANLEGEGRRRAGLYLLECLARANRFACGEVPWELLQQQPRLNPSHRLHLAVIRLDLDKLVRMAYVPARDGSWLSVQDLASTRRLASSLYLNERGLRILRSFLPPGCLE